MLLKFKPVSSKRDFVDRYRAGEFGNRAPTWNGYDDWLSDFPTNYRRDNKNLYHIRNRVAGGPTHYNIPAYSVAALWYDLIRQGVPSHNLYISEMAPTEKTLIQGEVMQTPEGLNLYYSNVAKPMREALKESSDTATGIEAVTILRHYLCPASYDWLEILLERYPGHVIEFSTYSVQWGSIPGFNTVFWEVRNY